MYKRDMVHNYDYMIAHFLQSDKLAPRQPRAWSVNDFISLALTYKGGWQVLSLTVCLIFPDSVLIIAEFTRECMQSINLEPNLCPGGLEPWTSRVIVQHANHNTIKHHYSVH